MKIIHLLIVLLLLTSCGIAQPHTPLTERLQALAIHSNNSGLATPSNTLRLVSLNLAHGRLDSFHQLFVSSEQIKTNLNTVANFLIDTDADIVALQEADGPSRWSGNFDHVDYLATKADFNYYVRAENVNNYFGDYGSGVLSQQPITEAQGFTFEPSPPTSSKGFSVAQVQWQRLGDDQPLLIDVVSVHLDFSRDSVRQSQIEEIKQVLALRTNNKSSNTIIMGDFNSEWLAREYMLERFAENSPLHVFEPASQTLNTYGAKRIDWILLSNNLEFVSHTVNDTVLSDHRALVAEIKLKD